MYFRKVFLLLLQCFICPTLAKVHQRDNGKLVETPLSSSGRRPRQEGKQEEKRHKVHSVQDDEQEDIKIISSSSDNYLERETQVDIPDKARIVNGETVAKYSNDYKWYTAIELSNGGVCGGSLITPEFVLTAAHCLTNVIENPSMVGKIRIGAYCRFGDPFECKDPFYTETVYFGYDNIFLHLSYQSPVSLSNDFALIKLNDIPYTTPVKIDRGAFSPSYSAGKKLWVIGLGLLNYPNGEFPSELQHVEIAYIRNNVCKSQYDKDPIRRDQVDDTMMCAADPGENSCKGDSGGPLYDAENDLLVGVVSWAKECALDEFPSVYGRISEAWPWIQFVVCTYQNFPDSNNFCESTPAPSPVAKPCAAENKNSRYWNGNVVEKKGILRAKKKKCKWLAKQSNYKKWQHCGRTERFELQWKTIPVARDVCTKTCCDYLS